MKSVLKTCQPRQEILGGTFNPEVFTASLSPVIDYYRTGNQVIDNIYTNAEMFFCDATFPTLGFKNTLFEVFSRIKGDASVPAIHRLETAFGGGKTHTLIACTHIACRGKELQGVTDSILNPNLLPDKGSVSVVGVAGDEIPVHKPKGKTLVPYTLWGEIAYQIGGENLYYQVEDEANSYAAPGKNYFDAVLSGRKALIMLDELAQYAARLEAARPDGANQLAAFLMALHGYARNHTGIAIVLTLASATDAFSRQTERLAQLITQVRGEDVSLDDALGIGEQAIKGVASVVARDAVQITPVQATEISSVLAKRLFVSIDREAAIEITAEYMNMYRRNSSYLPEEASNENYLNRMSANYPFHPTLVDFLNKKLAESENFQGTRGVLRVLALVVRSIWEKQIPVPMIHTCHIDLKSDKVVNEILGRTGSSDLLLVLNADIGSVDTYTLEGGRSNAEIADNRNPHPEGYPYHEYTWKTVFLHSLVGRAGGLSSKIFGITEPEALFNVSFPGLTPPQVRLALQEISESAFYLRYEQGRYFASDEPTINSILARIRNTLNLDEINSLIEITARKIINESSGLFNIEYDVSLPEHVPDVGRSKPILGVVSPVAEEIDIEDIFTTKGPNNPRLYQNMIFLLVPETVVIKGFTHQPNLVQVSPAEKARQQLEIIARQVKALQMLSEKPQSYGINPRRLQDEDFMKRKAEREQALLTEVSGKYTRIYYPSISGHIISKEIKTAGGESGLPFVQIIRELLSKEGKLVTSANTTQSDLINLRKLFFESNDTASLKKLKENFLCFRRWPVLESQDVFDQIIRAGVEKGVWYVYCMGDETSIKPEELFTQEQVIPLDVDLWVKEYSIITPQGAKQRGWTENKSIDPQKIRTRIRYAVDEKGCVTVENVREVLNEEYGEIPSNDISELVAGLVKDNRFYAYHGTPEQEEKPDLIYGDKAVLYIPNPDDVLIMPARAAERGWVTTNPNQINLSGKEGLRKLLPLLRRMGSIYNKGANTSINLMELTELSLPGEGTLTIRLENIDPETIKALAELFEVLDTIVEEGEASDAFLEIKNFSDSCPFIQEIKNI